MPNTWHTPLNMSSQAAAYTNVLALYIAGIVGKQEYRRFGKFFNRPDTHHGDRGCCFGFVVQAVDETGTSEFIRISAVA